MWKWILRMSNELQKWINKITIKMIVLVTKINTWIINVKMNNENLKWIHL